MENKINKKDEIQIENEDKRQRSRTVFFQKKRSNLIEEDKLLKISSLPIFSDCINKIKEYENYIDIAKANEIQIKIKENYKNLKDDIHKEKEYLDQIVKALKLKEKEYNELLEADNIFLFNEEDEKNLNGDININEKNKLNIYCDLDEILLKYI